MSQHCGYIVKVERLRKHPNASALQIATFFGNDTCVGLDVKIGDVGIYFPADLQLSVEFCEENHMCRKRQDGTPDTGYLDPDKRNVKAIRLRGEKSDGIYCPLTALAFTEADINSFKPGDTIDVVNGHEICKKYIPRSNSYNYHKEGNHTRKKKVNIAPLFAEHADTEQLNYNLEAFKPGDEIEITLKMHGTSQRTGYLPILAENTFQWESVFMAGLYKIIPVRKWRLAFGNKFGKPVYNYGYVSGTRRTVLENYDGGFYGSNEFREQHSKTFEGKLWKGETVYYEVVGFTTSGQPIMADGNNEKLGKDFVKQYGKTTTFSYGCEPHPVVHEGYNDSTYGYQNEKIEYKAPQSDIYVYRMTMTNEDGDVVEYTPNFMRYRCEQMGVKYVPVMWKGVIPEHCSKTVAVDVAEKQFALASKTFDNAGEWIKDEAEKFYDGPDPIGKIHIREGVVVRIINRPKFTAFKTKNYNFKMIEGLIKEVAETPDLEEAEDLI